MSGREVGYVMAMGKPLLALFILGVMAIGLLIILLVGGTEVENDGVENDSIGWSGWPGGTADSQTGPVS